ncbi:aspartate aminotransferase family protein [Roseibium suaedae]|uniref:Acetylornithine aminotransferase n=1 Tax=Roseibium suaedae TaxID=735517 RepID=A0A1M7BBM5_9HYPH|nr:aspartate aminotransferase family protein [Roseibium suaedae]SHL52286.1 acetylornithine aminotransferase apoenzyme [Roseibium suaedae]
MSASTLFGTYARSGLEFDRGEGVWLVTGDGRRFLDCGSGIAVNSVGHSHPHLVAALTEQASKLWHTSNLHTPAGGEKLGQRLTEATFADKVFFTNSGAEAMEASIKAARRYHYDHGHPERFHILTFEGAFHGRTIATIAAGGQAKYLEGFGPKAPGFDQIPFTDIEAVKKAVGPQTAAICIEPVQGEGGIREIPVDFLRQLRKLCDDEGILLILDEIQTGVGRTGKLFAHEWAGITPDIMAIAKGIGGGFPLGACLATEAVASCMVPGTHGTTYGGNPLAMAVGNAVLDIILADGFLEGVQAKGLLLKQKLAALVDTHPKVVSDVRGKGLLLGLKCVVPVGEFVAKAREHGLLAVPAGDNVVRIIPPLTISEEEIDEALVRLDAAASAIEKTMSDEGATV